MANLSPSPKLQFFDANGNPLSGGKLYTYAAGTTTPLATYTDSGAGTPNTNPIILDSRGEANVWLGSSLYKFKLTTSADVEIWTVDNVSTGNADILALLAASNGSSLVGFLQSGTSATARTVQAKLRDFVSVKDFGATGDGITDDSAAIVTASATGKYVFFPEGTYRIGTNISPASIKWFSSSGAVIKFDEFITLTANNVSVDVEGLIFEGPFSAAQYTTGVISNTVKTAFDTPEYIDGSGNVYDGADFTHTQSGSYWTLSLASLTGATTRAIQSDFISLVETDRYVINFNAVPFGSYGNFDSVTIRTYNSSNVYLGDWDPAASAENLCLTGVAKIKIRCTLRRTANSSLTNPSTELRTNAFEFFKLTNNAATANLNTGFTSQTHFLLGTCSDPVIRNCRFRFMGYLPVSLANCKRAKITNNIVQQCWGGFASTNSTDTVVSNNIIDLRQLHTDNNLYNLKFLRHRGVGGTTSANMIANENVIYGANWGIEIINNAGIKTTCNNNTVFAEIAGLSIALADAGVVQGNTIVLPWGFAKYGIEVPGPHVDLDVSNNSIKFNGPTSAIGYGIGVTSGGAATVRGSICNNKINAPVGIFVSDVAVRAASFSIIGNTIDFYAAGIFLQYYGAQISSNTLRKIGDMYVYYLQNFGISVFTTNTQLTTINGNSVRAGTEGAIFVSQSAAIVSNNKISTDTVLPALFNITTTGSVSVNNNIFQGTAPTAYLARSGAGVIYSRNNRTISNAILLVGDNDDVYEYALAATGSGSPAAHVVTFTLRGRSVHLMSVRCKVGGDNNHMVMGTFLLSNWEDVTYDANGVAQLGTTVTSSGSPLVGSATMAATYNIATGEVTITTTQSGGSAGTASITYIQVRKLDN